MSPTHNRVDEGAQVTRTWVVGGVGMWASAGRAHCAAHPSAPDTAPRHTLENGTMRAMTFTEH
jgi:hypothetical protein